MEADRAAAVLVTGATGFVGRALVAALLQQGRPVIALSRDAQRARALLGAQVAVVDDLATIAAAEPVDAVVHLAGARVIGPPWTASRRRTLLESRVGTTAALLELMRRLEQPPRVFVAASAVGYYGTSPADARFAPRDESSPPQPGQFASDLCMAIEREALRVEALGARVVCLRLAVVLGRDDGAYAPLARSARLGLAAVLGSGEQAAPWIHLDDAVRLIGLAIADPRLRGAVNAVAPDVPTQRRFVQALAASYGRRVRLRVPAFCLRALGGEMSSLLLEGQNVQPRAATEAGFTFTHDRLEPALQALADGTRARRG